LGYACTSAVNVGKLQIKVQYCAYYAHSINYHLIRDFFHLIGAYYYTYEELKRDRSKFAPNLPHTRRAYPSIEVSQRIYKITKLSLNTFSF
jgi:hypothetical protein